MERKIAALFVADAVAYSKRMEENEAAAMAAIEASRGIIDAAIAQQDGTIIQTAGDSVIAWFPGAVAAVSAALDIQQQLDASETDVFTFRIGVHFGDVGLTERDVLGDGLNVAARLESLAPPGSILISGVVADQVVGKVDAQFTGVGRRKLKNIERPIEVYCWPEKVARDMRRASAIKTWMRGGAVAVPVLAILAALMVWPSDEEVTMPTGPRIVVLPFEEVGTPQEEAFFAKGLSRDINALLSAFSNLFVIAPSTAQTVRGEDCQSIRRDLDTDFILEGTVRRDGDQLRVTTIFMDASTCRQLDSPGPFNRNLSADSVLNVQLEIAQKIVAQIGSSDAPLFDDEIVRDFEKKAPENLTSYECVLLSYWFYENFEPDRHRRARACLENAVRSDPTYSLGWSRLAVAYNESKKYSIDTDLNWAEKSWEAVQKAIDLNPENPDAYYALAIRSQILGEERSVFRNYARKAIELNPYDSFVLADLGTWMAYSGEWETGKEWVTRAKALNPKHQSWWNFIWQLHAYQQGEYAASIEYAHIVNLPGNYMVQSALAAAYAMNGNAKKAEETLAAVLELKPDYADDPEQPFRARGMEEELIDKLMEGLRKAGLNPA